MDVADEPTNSNTGSTSQCLWYSDDEVAIGNVTVSTLREQAASELLKYRLLAKIPMDSDPVKYFASVENAIPNVTKLALRYAVVQATSIAAERIFSIAGASYPWSVLDWVQSKWTH